MNSLALGSFVELLVRALHVLAALIWFGFLFFQNLVVVEAQSSFEKPFELNVINPKLQGRAITWAKSAAWATAIFGLILYLRIYWWNGSHFGPSGYLVDTAGQLSGRSWWIHAGMLLGLTMWAYFSFVAGPIYPKILPAPPVGRPPSPGEVKRLKFGSKMNAYLSVPVLILMLGVAHYGVLNPLLPIAILIGVGLVVLLLRLAKRIRGF